MVLNTIELNIEFCLQSSTAMHLYTNMKSVKRCGLCLNRRKWIARNLIKQYEANNTKNRASGISV